MTQAVNCYRCCQCSILPVGADEARPLRGGCADMASGGHGAEGTGRVGSMLHITSVLQLPSL